MSLQVFWRVPGDDDGSLLFVRDIAVAYDRRRRVTPHADGDTLPLPCCDQATTVS